MYLHSEKFKAPIRDNFTLFLINNPFSKLLFLGTSWIISLRAVTLEVFCYFNGSQESFCRILNRAFEENRERFSVTIRESPQVIMKN